MWDADPSSQVLSAPPLSSSSSLPSCGPRLLQRAHEEAGPGAGGQRGGPGLPAPCLTQGPVLLEERRGGCAGQWKVLTPPPTERPVTREQPKSHSSYSASTRVCRGEQHRAVPGWGVSKVYRSRVQVRGGQATWPLESRRWGELKWRQGPVGWGCQEPACWEEKRVLPQPSALPSCLGSSGRA